MGTLGEKLSYLKETKEAIKTAMTDKGVSVSDDTTFREYAEKIGKMYSLTNVASGNFGKHFVIEEDLFPSKQAFSYANMETLVINSILNDYGYAGETFVHCDNLKTVTINGAVKLGPSAFSYCNALERVEIINGTAWLNSYAFSGLSSLKEAIVPGLNGNGYMPFANCPALYLCELRDIGTIQDALFNNSPALTKLVLRKNTLMPLGNMHVFTGTPFDTNGSGGTVYCPAALIEEYKVATNWATYYEAGTMTFEALEGSEYE